MNSEVVKWFGVVMAGVGIWQAFQGDAPGEEYWAWIATLGGAGLASFSQKIVQWLGGGTGIDKSHDGKKDSEIPPPEPTRDEVLHCVETLSRQAKKLDNEKLISLMAGVQTEFHTHYHGKPKQ